MLCFEEGIMKIHFSIENGNTEKFRRLALRKFYQVVFYNKLVSQVVVYTAVVVGDLKDANSYFKQTGSTRRKKKEDAQYTHSLQSLSIKVTCKCPGSRISYEDVTETVLNDPRWGHVWGGEACIICVTPDARRDKIQEVSEKMFPGIQFSGVNGDKYNKLCYMFEQSKDNNNSHRVLAMPVDLDINTDSYYINGVGVDVHHCIDFINWSKATIQLDKSEKIENDDDLLYDYELHFVGNFIVDDLSMYFIMPNMYRVDENQQYGSCVVRLKDGLGGDGNPKIEFGNPISIVRKNDNAYLDIWVKEYDIVSRRVYRMRKDFVDSNRLRNNLESISLAIPIYSEVSVATKEYVVPFVCAIFLAFSVDKTRVEAYKEYYAMEEFIPPDVQWLIGVVLLTLLFPYVILCSEKNEPRLVRLLRFAGYFFICIWASVAYWVGPVFGIRVELKHMLGYCLIVAFLCFLITIVVARTRYKNQYSGHNITIKL
jgi:hypothetical protein